MVKIGKHQTEGSGWTSDSVIKQDIKFSKCKPLNGSSYIKLQKELNKSRKRLTNIQSIDDNECIYSV